MLNIVCVIMHSVVMRIMLMAATAIRLTAGMNFVCLLILIILF